MDLLCTQIISNQGVPQPWTQLILCQSRLVSHLPPSVPRHGEVCVFSLYSVTQSLTSVCLFSACSYSLHPHVKNRGWTSGQIAGVKSVRLRACITFAHCLPVQDCTSKPSCPQLANCRGNHRPSSFQMSREQLIVLTIG